VSRDRTGPPVSTVAQHYAEHLAPIYEWMAGGLEAAVACSVIELSELGLLQRPAGQVVDLGAGFGPHAIAMARGGHDVLALDTSALLLERLRLAAAGLPVRTVEADLLAFRRHLVRPADLILCMGDTLTHLPDVSWVASLIDEIVAGLASDGVFVATFRDYSVALEAERRFIAVKSDAARILTCFLEFQREHVVVHDLLHERLEQQWQQRVSAYRKLRLAPGDVCAQLGAHGLTVRQDAGPAGMVRVIARRG
jgi:SAM-dependent methyltransferase